MREMGVNMTKTHCVHCGGVYIVVFNLIHPGRGSLNCVIAFIILEYVDVCGTFSSLFVDV